MIRTAAVVLAAVVTVVGGLLHAHPEIEAALDRLNARIAVAPDCADLYVERGELYARHEDWIAAEANYLLAAELAPNLPRLERDRATLALATGRWLEARTRLDQVLRRDPSDGEAYVLRARAAARLGDRRAALADFETALTHLAAPNPDLFLERAALQASAADAIRSLDEGIARLGPVVVLHLRALALEESLGRTAAALARLDLLAAQGERREAWLKRRGDLLTRTGRTAEARTAYASALAAIAALPAWLRASPETAQLSAELARLTAPDSPSTS